MLRNPTKGSATLPECIGFASHVALRCQRDALPSAAGCRITIRLPSWPEIA